MKLYEFDSRIEELLNGKVDPETGEVLTDENGNPLFDSEALEALNMEKAEKMHHCVLADLNLAAEESALDAEIKKLTARKKKTSKRREWLEIYIRRYSENREWNFPEADIKFRTSTVVDVDEDLDLAKLSRSKVWKPFLKAEYKIDKVELGKALKSGFKCKNARLITRTNMKIK